MTPPLRIVASPGDALAGAFEGLARSRGRGVDRLTHDEAAASISIEVAPDGLRIVPDAALFLRPPLERPAEDEDAAFLQAERQAHLWAAAALSRFPVVNRPTPAGLWGRATYSGAVTERRAGLVSRRNEVFCTDAFLRPWPGAWAAARPDGVVLPWPATQTGPFRARPIDAGEEYEAVIVAGDLAWHRTDTPLWDLELDARSVAAARNLELTFAVVWWAIPPAADSSALVRVVPAPSFADVAPRWPLVGETLLSLLS